jgi:hypothetical protein
MSTYRLRKAMKLVGRAGAYTERPLVTQAEDGTPLAFSVGMGHTAYMDCCNWASPSALASLGRSAARRLAPERDYGEPMNECSTQVLAPACS